jgi:hypothetical protein
VVHAARCVWSAGSLVVIRPVSAAAAAAGSTNEYAVPAIGLNGVACRLLEVQDAVCVVSMFDRMTSSVLTVSVPTASVHAVDKLFGELANEGAPMVP